MGPGAETAGEAFIGRRAGALRPDRARRTASRRTSRAPRDTGADDQAQAVVDGVVLHLSAPDRQGGAAAWGMARQMALCALLLEQDDPRGLEASLDRAVRVYRQAEATTVAAVKKHASEARAILRYGVAGEGGSLAAAIRAGGRSIGELEELLQAIKTRETFERRARDLSGQRGGRPSGDAFRVLSAVARLKESAGSGDPKAEAELKLVRTFLADD